MRTDPPIGLVPPPARRLSNHPMNGATAQVYLGDGAYSGIVNPWFEGGVEWTLRYGDPEIPRYTAASLIASYDYLLSGAITTGEAIRRLRILRAARKQVTPDFDPLTGGSND